MSSSVSSRGCANGRPSAARWAPAAGPVVSGLLARMGGSRMASRPNMLPRNSASKSRAHAPVSGSSHPSRRSGWMSIRTPGGGGGRRPWSCARTRAGPRTCARRRRGGQRPGARIRRADDAERRRAGGIVVEVRPRGDAEGGGATRASSSRRRATPATRPSRGRGRGRGERRGGAREGKVLLPPRGRTPGRGAWGETPGRGAGRAENAGGRGARARCCRGHGARHRTPRGAGEGWRGRRRRRA